MKIQKMVGKWGKCDGKKETETVRVWDSETRANALDAPLFYTLCPIPLNHRARASRVGVSTVFIPGLP